MQPRRPLYHRKMTNYWIWSPARLQVPGSLALATRSQQPLRRTQKRLSEDQGTVFEDETQ